MFLLQSQRGGVFADKPDIVKGSEKANNRSMVSLHELSEFSEIARYKVIFLNIPSGKIQIYLHSR